MVLIPRRSPAFSRPKAGRPITQYATTSAGADSYRLLAREVLAKVDPASMGKGESVLVLPGAEQLAFS